MKILKYIGARFRCACVYFTCTELLVSIVTQLSGEKGSEASFIGPALTLYIVFFGLCLSFAQELFKLKTSLTARVLLHSLVYLLSVFFLYTLATGGIKDVNNLVMMLVFAVLIYVVAGGLILLGFALYNRGKVEKTEYVSQFDGKGKKK